MHALKKRTRHGDGEPTKVNKICGMQVDIYNQIQDRQENQNVQNKTCGKEPYIDLYDTLPRNIRTSNQDEHSADFVVFSCSL